MLRRSSLSALVLPMLVAILVILTLWAVWTAARPALEEIGGAVQSVSGY